MTISSAALYHTSQIRDCEQRAIRDSGITEAELMARAGRAAFVLVQQSFPLAHKIVIFCGSGNNAGDGYVLASLLHNAGYSIVINQYKSPDKLPPSARDAALAALALGIHCHSVDEGIDNDTDLIVDALLGTGLNGRVQEPLVTAITQINESELPVLSLDVPSGLDADTGNVMGVCVRATTTITFIGQKAGMMTLDGPDQCGEIVCNDLNLTVHLSTICPVAEILDSHLSATLLPKRLRNCHKNEFGHVLIIGGGIGMPGSVCLAANAALRVGAGVVTVATKPVYAGQALCGLPEAMIAPIDEASCLLPLINKATVCVIGPGLGLDEWAVQLFRQVIASQLPMVIDASALRILAQSPQEDDNWILTPHPGEAASLLGCRAQDIQADRYHAATQLQAKYGGNVVLKGVGTLVRTSEPLTWLCDRGNPGMASAGMGDVLSGVIAGLVGQGLSLADAAKTGVWLHASAADLAVRKSGERGLLASDLMPYLRLLVNE
ncbi:MAG: NAD(P)H-hydrate dehydratase [Legionella sp.]|nr:NAD(P)H-hydrate dehydratase [Legionella sp.]